MNGFATPSPAHPTRAWGAGDTPRTLQMHGYRNDDEDHDRDGGQHENHSGDAREDHQFPHLAHLSPLLFLHFLVGRLLVPQRVWRRREAAWRRVVQPQLLPPAVPGAS